MLAESRAGLTRTRITYQPALDGIRALAVIAVILYHLDLPRAKGGFLGVDTFFVLSGFLITTLLLKERSTTGAIRFRAFWARRARRLLPALFLLLIGVSIAATLWTPAYQLPALRWDAIASLFYYANWHFISTGQSYFELFVDPSPLQHLWSLAIEEQFYIVWPVIVAGVLLVRRAPRAVLLAAIVGGIIASQATMTLLYDVADPSRAYYGTGLAPTRSSWAHSLR